MSRVISTAPRQRRYKVAFSAVWVLTAALHVGSAQDPRDTTLSDVERAYPLRLSLRLESEASIARGADFLEERQAANGSWASNPAVTSYAALAHLNMGTRADDDAGAPLIRALDFLASCSGKSGAIVNKGTRQYALPTTAVALQALVQGSRPEHLGAAMGAQSYILGTQHKGGGFPTVPGRTPDLIATVYALEALNIARLRQLGGPDALSPDAPALASAGRFILSCQQIDRVETTDPQSMPGFFHPRPGGNKGLETTVAMPASRALLTCAGLRGMLYSGVPPTSERVLSAVSWLEVNAGVDENPGFGEHGYYTYLLGYARTLRACDLAGVNLSNAPNLRNWRNALTGELLRRQAGPGVWRPGLPEWWENKPELVTSYAMFALANALL